MIRFLADENFNNDVIRGLVRRMPDLDIVRAQDVGLAGADDPTVLDWATAEGRIVLSHDLATLIGFAYERIRNGEPVVGLVAIPQSLALANVLEDLLLIATCSSMDEWAGIVAYLPLR